MSIITLYVVLGVIKVIALILTVKEMKKYEQ
jgi:hypothetical protein